MYKLLIFSLLTLSLQAQEFKNSLEFGFKTTAFDYTERDDNDAVIDTEESDLFGINGLYANFDYALDSYILDDATILYYLNIKTDYTVGDTDYIGSYLNPNDGSQTYGSLRNTTYNEIFNLEVNLKRVTQYNSKSTYISAGLGYHQWFRELSNTQEETYYYFYAGISLGGDLTIYKNWLLGLDFSALLGLNPKMDADFSETTNTNALNETFNLGTVYTYKVGVPLTIPINKQLSFKTKMEYEFSSYGKSDVVTKQNYYKTEPTPGAGLNAGFLEPKSQLKNWNFYTGLELIF